MNVTQVGNQFKCDCGFTWVEGKSGAHECGEGLRRQIASLEGQRDALAAENAALKEFPRQLLKFIRTLGTAEIGSQTYSKIESAVARMKTPATDAYLNSVRAEAIPEGYVLVPKEMCLSANAMEAICFHCGDGDHMFGEFTDGILWVGEIDHGDGNKTYGLNIATADYPDEGSGVVCEFINPSSEACAVKDGE